MDAWTTFYENRILTELCSVVKSNVAIHFDGKHSFKTLTVAVAVYFVIVLICRSSPDFSRWEQISDGGGIFHNSSLAPRLLGSHYYSFIILMSNNVGIT